MCAVSAYSQGCLPEGITFYTQSEIDSFPVNYPGCSRIEGNVEISYNSSITNLDSLSVIFSIAGHLSISHCSALTDLSGLNNLDSVGGNLYIMNNYDLQAIDGFTDLQYIGGILRIIVISGLHRYQLSPMSLMISSMNLLLRIIGIWSPVPRL